MVFPGFSGLPARSSIVTATWTASFLSDVAKHENPAAVTSSFTSLDAQGRALRAVNMGPRPMTAGGTSVSCYSQVGCHAKYQRVPLLVTSDIGRTSVREEDPGLRGPRRASPLGIVDVDTSHSPNPTVRRYRRQLA